jgi:hypothetical protein
MVRLRLSGTAAGGRCSLEITAYPRLAWLVAGAEGNSGRAE